MLENISDEELKAEMARRQLVADAEALPKQLESFDWEPLKKACQDHINAIESDEYDSDDDHYIYESAMETIYGPNVWAWINKRLR